MAVHVVCMAVVWLNPDVGWVEHGATNVADHGGVLTARCIAIRHCVPDEHGSN